MKHLLYIYLCLLAFMACQPKTTTLTILHTNDTHSQVEATAPNATKNANMGGYARRMGLIAQQRLADPNLLLLDAGDFSQGTPYFNFYHGRIEIDALNRMGYDVVTLGNHEFDNGIDTLAAVLKEATFQVVCANYDVTHTALEGLVKRYTILHRNGLKIGIFGIGVNPHNLISAKNFAPIRYLEPLPVINEMGQLLKEQEKCDLVICLSHLGTDNSNGQSDEVFAPQSRNVDLFIGGHTHHLIDGERVTNADGEEVILSQMGKAGLNVGKIVLHLAPAK